MQILVALVGDPNSAGELPEDEHWRAVRFDDRPRVTLAAEDDETLGNVMSTAAREFDARHQSGHDFYPAFIAFDQGGFRWPQLTTVLDLVGEDGRVSWNNPWHAVTIGELRKAEAAGLIPGDASRWYLVLVSPMGNGFPVEWSDVVAAWFLVEKLLSWIADAYGSSEAISRIVSKVRAGRLKDLPEVLDRHAVDWSDRGAAPPDLCRLLSMDQWDSASLTALLGCSTEETEAILWSHGYSYDIVDGVWKKERTQEAALLSHIARVVDNIELRLPTEKERLQARLLGVIRSHAARFFER